MTEATRTAFERARERVADLQREGAGAPDIVRTHTEDVDEIVVGTFHAALRSLSFRSDGVVLVALGSYGRRELATGSDLDLLLLHSGWRPADVTALNRALMYPLWDSRRDVGDRVRSPRDVVRNLDRVDEICALMDARYLAGDRSLFVDLEGQLRGRLERARHSFFKDLTAATSERHQRFGHGGHLLEPNLRDSAGGLRDIQTLSWAAKLLPGGDDVSALASAGFVSERDAKLIDAARSFLLRIRIQLHLVTGRHQDQLYLTEQDDIARDLGYGAKGSKPPADELMQEFYEHTRQVDAIVSSFWDHVLHATRRRFFRGSSSEPVGDGCVLQEGRLEVVAVTHVRDDPAAWLRVFHRAMRMDSRIGRVSLQRLHDELTSTPQLRWTPEARESFFDILESGSARALEALDLSGLLGALIDGWDEIRGYPQRDLYHRYTVDRHLAVATSELASSRSSDERDVKDAWAHVGDTEPLFLAALLHDIGKGRDGDHSDIGAEIVSGVASQMGLREEHREDTVFLVREHLLLANVATRRDLSDPRTVDEVVARVGDRTRLAMLYLLTRADSLATGPEAWSSFRASLVRELYTKARQQLEGAPAGVADASQQLVQIAEALNCSPEEAIALAGPMPEAWARDLDVDAAVRQLALLREPLGPHEVRTAVQRADDADEFILVAHDRPGLFSIVTGALALRGIDVHDAEIYTRSDQTAVEIFRVIGAHGQIPEDRWARVRNDVIAALGGSFDLDAELAKKRRASHRARRQGVKRAQPEIVVDNEASETHTVVEIHASDRLGLLRVITKALTDTGCDLSFAKVATYGMDVVDAFYVRDLDGHKVTGLEHVAQIENALRSALGSSA